MGAAANYPRLLRRVRAVLIDTCLVFAVVFSWWLILPLLQGYPAAVKIAYLVLAWFLLDPFLVWRFAGTPGHWMMGLRIQHARSMENPGLVRAVLRSLVKSLTGWWSFIWVLMTKRHQALHDVLTGTTVVLRSPGSLPVWERRSERLQDVENFRYPSIYLRLLIIVLYLFVCVIVFIALLAVLLPQGCVMSDRCNQRDTAIFYVLQWAWFIALAVVVVAGWRSRLYGARRKPIQ